MKKFYEVCDAISISLTSGIFFLFCISVLGFLCGFSIIFIYPIFAFLCTLIIFSIKLNKYNFSKNSILITSAIYICIILFLVKIATNIIDISWDGRTYHQTAIIFLKNGWNPFYQNAVDYAENHFNFQFIEQSLIWVQHYVKFPEIFASNLFALTRHIESGKVINYFSILTLFCYSLFSLSKPLFNKISTLKKLVFAFLLIINPVVIQQMSTYYMDGLLYCYFMLALLGFINIDKTDKISKSDIFIIFASLIIIANIKFGGLYYAILLLFLYFVHLRITKNTKFLSTYKHFVFYIFAAIILTGINPYITNLKERHNIFYPIIGNEKISILKSSTPKQFINKSMPYKLFYSTFAETINTSYKANRNIKLKVPFSFHISELIHLKDPDIRIGGFGIFWSGILILSFIILLAVNFSENKKAFLMPITFLIISVLSNPENWWARYVPQFWALPVFILIFISMSKNSKLIKMTSLFLVLTILFNSLIIFRFNYIHTIKTGHKIREFLQNHNKNVSLYYPADMLFEFSFLQKLEDYNYNYKIIDKKEFDKDKNHYELIPYTVTEKVYWK